MGRFLFRVSLCFLILTAARLASAVIGGNDPPNLDVDVACCVPEVELPPAACVSEDPFTTEDGYCTEGLRADGSQFCHTKGSCACAALTLQGVWESADCVIVLLGAHDSNPPKCCRVYKALECTVWDGVCESELNNSGSNGGFECTGCAMTLTEPQPLVLPWQLDVVVCDVGRGGNCKVCDPE